MKVFWLMAVSQFPANKYQRINREGGFREQVV